MNLDQQLYLVTTYSGINR